MSFQLLIDNMLHLPALAFLYFSSIAVAGGDREPPSAPADPRPWKAVCLAGMALSLAAPLPRVLAARWQGVAWESRSAEAARKAVAIFPGDDYLRGLLARTCVWSEPPDLATAFRELRIAADLNPFSALHPLMAAEIHLSKRRYAMALPLVSGAIRLEPNFFAARMMRAEIWARLGKTRMAEWELAEARRRSALVKVSEISSQYAVFILRFDGKRYDAAARSVAASRRRPRGAKGARS
jgi:tetratricopeptide (TPR) repeat protein